MKLKFPVFAAIVIWSFTGAAHGAHDKTALPAEAQAKPRLEVPLGTEVLVEATIVRADDLGCKELGGRYVLEVSRVNGKALERKQVFQFRAQKELAKKLPWDVFELYQLRTGKVVDEMTPAQIEATEKGYVGLGLELMASELPAKAREGKTEIPTLLLSKCLKGL